MLEFSHLDIMTEEEILEESRLQQKMMEQDDASLEIGNLTPLPSAASGPQRYVLISTT